MVILAGMITLTEMDLVDSQFNAIVEKSRVTTGQTISLHQLKDSHDVALRTLLHGCFQDGSRPSITINKSILKILDCVGRSCDLVEIILNSGQKEFDSIESFNSLENVFSHVTQELDNEFEFLFEIFEGIQDSSKSLLSQFLIRFDFSGWFSKISVER